MLYAIARRSTTNAKEIRFLGTASSRSSVSVLLFGSEADAKEEMAKHSPRYSIVPISSLFADNVNGSGVMIIPPDATTNVRGVKAKKAKAEKPDGVYEMYRGRAIRKSGDGYRAGNLRASTRDGIRLAIRQAQPRQVFAR